MTNDKKRMVTMKKNVTIYTDSEIWDKFTSDCRENGKNIGYTLSKVLTEYLLKNTDDTK